MLFIQEFHLVPDYDRDAVRRMWDADAADYDGRLGDELAAKPFERSLLDEAGRAMRELGPVIDLGCGPAQVARYLGDRGVKTVGVDLAKGMLVAARRRAPQLPLVAGDALDLPFATGSCGGVVAFYSLHNLLRQMFPRAVSEMRRVVRTGGSLLIATHGGTGETFYPDLRVVATYYSGDELSAMLSDQGFDIDWIRHRTPLADEHRATKLFVLAHKK